MFIYSHLGFEIMLDIQFIRENSELVKDNMRKKFRNDLSIVDQVIELYKKWRMLKSSSDDLRRERNELTAKVAELKKQGKSADEFLAKAKVFPEKIKITDEEVSVLRKKIDSLLFSIPNIMHSSVPSGKNDSENVEIKKFGVPKKFSFKPKNHAELAELLGVADFELASRTSGAGFYFIEGELALLNQAVLRFAIDFMTKNGYRYVETPLMLRGDIMGRVTDLNDQEKMIYKIDNEDLYLIGTSEHSLIGRFVDEAISESVLPIKNTSYSMCFRKEIGAHGIEEKGLYRRHQFNKVEMVVICRPTDSMKFYNEMKQITIDLFQALEIPIRELAICSGDLGDLKHVQVDIEAWSPVKNDYYEVGSCSNLTDAQARRLGIRVSQQNERYVPHTVNNTAVATSRALVAILENFQQKDGSVKVPKVLWKYCGFKKIVPKSQ